MGLRKTRSAPHQIDDSLLLMLQFHAATREVEQGIVLLENHIKGNFLCSPETKNAARYLAHLAVWVDIGFNGLDQLKRLLAAFEPRLRSRLSLADYIHLRMAEGMVAMREEVMQTALEHFDFVLSLCHEWDDKFLLSIVHYWKGRCLRKKGEYAEALLFTTRGKDLALELNHPRMAAVMRVLESWLLFQQGKTKEATRISQNAEAALRDTEDYVTMGNIQSFYGRLARREGRYDAAVDLFVRAIDLFRKRDAEHPNLARSLANMALAKRWIALQLQKRIDRESVRSRKSLDKRGPKATSRGDDRRRLLLLRHEALQHLTDARAIYREHPNYHGEGTVCLNAAYIHMDNGDFQLAESESAAAYLRAEEKQDYILMGRARVLQCMIENAKLEEEISEGGDSGSHARRALGFIQEAVELATQTQNALLQARAHLWHGLTHCNSFFDNSEAAQRSYDLAREFCKGNQQDVIREDLQTLRSKIVPPGTINPALRAWSQGSVGEKTFQQITEEFAEIVIPRVWEREGRKVSRVAARLSISPKKVRRILDRVSPRKPQ